MRERKREINTKRWKEREIERKREIVIEKERDKERKDSEIEK